jgi:DNA modification methylase
MDNFKDYKIQVWGIDKIIPYARNPRKNTNAIAKVKGSIKEFGFQNPINIDKEGVIITGHTRFVAALELGYKELPVRVVDNISDAKIKAYRIADNKVSEFSEWDEDFLSLELRELESDGTVDLASIGFDEEQLNKYLDEMEIAGGLVDDEEAPALTNDPVSKEGDIWLLGSHRVMCGNSLMIDDIDKLLAKNNVDIVYTDPPYGINEKTDRTSRSAGGSTFAKSNKFKKIIGDNTIKTAIEAYAICDSLSQIICYWGGNYYANSLPASACWLVWDKRVEEKQKNNNSDCELAYVKHPIKKSVRIFRHLWKGLIKDSEHGQSRVHPTQKTVALAEWAINELKKDAHTVLDLFGGSGSTLIACEKIGKIAFLMELEPLYCDVIIKRWQQFTGKKAMLGSTGKEFTS